MQPIAEQIEERVAPFLFPNPAKAFASPLIRLEGAAVGYVAGPARCCRAWTCGSTPTTASACSAPTATARARSPS